MKNLHSNTPSNDVPNRVLELLVFEHLTPFFSTLDSTLFSTQSVSRFHKVIKIRIFTSFGFNSDLLLFGIYVKD